MGRSHALAYHHNPAFDLVGLVNRSTPRLDPALTGYAITPDYYEALARLKPDLVLVPIGGHNTLEAAALGVPVLIGPHTFNFEEISERLFSDWGMAYVPSSKLTRELLLRYGVGDEYSPLKMSSRSCLGLLTALRAQIAVA